MKRISGVISIRIWGIFIPLCAGTVIALVGIIFDYYGMCIGGIGMLVSAFIASLSRVKKARSRSSKGGDNLEKA